MKREEMSLNFGFGLQIFNW